MTPPSQLYRFFLYDQAVPIPHMYVMLSRDSTWDEAHLSRRYFVIAAACSRSEALFWTDQAAQYSYNVDDIKMTLHNYFKSLQSLLLLNTSWPGKQASGLPRRGTNRYFLPEIQVIYEESSGKLEWGDTIGSQGWRNAYTSGSFAWRLAKAPIRFPLFGISKIPTSFFRVLHIARAGLRTLYAPCR